MFTPGQKIFAIVFVIAFVIVIVVSYRKDKRIHLKQYKGSIKVLFGFLIFMGLLILIKYLITR